MIEPEYKSYAHAGATRIRWLRCIRPLSQWRLRIAVAIGMTAGGLSNLPSELNAQVAVQAVVATQQPGQGTPAQGAPANAAAGNAGAKPSPPAFTATTIEDKQYQGKDAEFKDGQLTIKSDPPQTVAMEELQRLVLAHEFKLAIDWIGQKEVDLVQIGAADGGNGVRDVQLHVTGLAAKGLKQVAIVSKPQFRVWRSDVKNSPYWKIAVERVGQASVAELYFEPPTRDLFETEIEVTFTYDDNSNSKATVKATSHTNDKTDPEYPVEKLATKVNRVATIYAQGGDLLNGRVLRGDSENFTIETSWLPQLEVPFGQIRGIFFDGSKPEVKTKFDQQLAKPGEDDFVLVLSKDGGIAEISGRLQGLSDGSLRITYEGQQRSIKLERVQALVLGHEPSVRSWKGPFQVFRMSSGDLFSATLQSLDEKTLKLKASWGVDVDVPRESVVELTGRNTRMVNLSELTPLTVEQVPYFDRKMAFVKDKSWNDRPLKLDGKTYSRGLAVHSRCILTYDLAGEYATFRAIVGFEEEAGDRGRVVCRVIADDKELFAKPDFRSVDKPVVVQVSVKGMKQLRLEVDFGEDEDIGDRVIWANARLFRE
ncbi:NPCBM/NEW2 domain-containing protein [Schlesneria paludicola]|uniref:NPCBM/NEW2 domain-containing protein n=1 Tax=Schlesneria paludicola TaxID=360056 RepID=UPI00029B3531|nr:NPCBM/NEW2 domain-containing protein [Schlesneria paludicola]